MSAIEQQSTLTTKGSIGRDGKLTSEMWKALLCMIWFSRNTNRKRESTLRYFKSVTALIQWDAPDLAALHHSPYFAAVICCRFRPIPAVGKWVKMLRRVPSEPPFAASAKSRNNGTHRLRDQAAIKRERSDFCVLPPCHTLLAILTTELSEHKRPAALNFPPNGFKPLASSRSASANLFLIFSPEF